jgi:thiamine pyrophosphokinase
MIPNCIVGDFDSIRSEVQEFFSKKSVKMFMKQDQDTTDLEKCLYVSLEKISEIQVESESESESENINYNYFPSNKKNIDSANYQNYYDNLRKNKKKFSILILGASGGRIDHTFSAYSQVYKYLNMYSNEFIDIEILMMSKSSCSIYLKPGKNVVFLTKTWEKKNQGYSIIPLFGEGKLTIYENEEIEEKKNGIFFFNFLLIFICIKISQIFIKSVNLFV